MVNWIKQWKWLVSNLVIFSTNKMTEVLDLHQSALLLRNCISDTPAPTNPLSVRKDDVTKLIPETLYMFIILILTGEDEEQDDDSSNCVTLSICRDTVYAVSKRKRLMPKHVGVGMSIHQATRSKLLVKLLHNAGHCISYDQV